MLGGKNNTYKTHRRRTQCKPLISVRYNILSTSTRYNILSTSTLTYPRAHIVSFSWSKFPLVVRRIDNYIIKQWKNHIYSLITKGWKCFYQSSNALVLWWFHRVDLLLFLAVGVNLRHMKLTNEIPVIQMTQLVSNGINTVESELLREKNPK